MSCYWIASDQPRLLRGRHAEDCVESLWHTPLAWVDCAGCQPCTLAHCGICSRVHVDGLHCASCVGDVRTDLGDIVRLSGLPLVEEALTRGAQSEAAHLLGPTADPNAWRQRRRYGYRDHLATDRNGATYRADVVGENHPLWVLGTWDLLVTEHLGHTRTTAVTISGRPTTSSET